MGKTFLSLGLVLFLCLFFIGCFTKDPENDTGHFDEENISITGEDGLNLTISQGELPENFPRDIPLYPKAKLLQSMAYSDKNVLVISLETKDSIDNIEKYYNKELQSSGWKINKVFSTDKSKMFTGKKDDRNISISITIEKESMNNIAISLSVD